MFNRIHSAMAASGIDALLISDPLNVQWATEFTGSFGYVLATQSEALFITDSRYTLQAQAQVKGCPVVSFSSPKTGLDVLQENLTKLGVKRLAFEPSITYGTWESWGKRFEGTELHSAGDVLTNLRKVKTADEIRRIREACKLADACVEHVSRMVQVGVSEYDIGLDIEFFFRRTGAGIAFEPIVASGPNSAKPHGRASERKLERGDFLTLDLGCTLDGYNSDITRTFVVGEASDRHRELYDSVLKAIETTKQMLVPGANGRDIDKKAREILNERDLAKYFGHSLGHGLGRNVHDPGRLHETADEPIQTGMVFTVEPGVYIDGWGGLRLEDDVVVTEGAPEVLTSYPLELQVLG